MKTEIIIAVRGEIPGNLERTVDEALKVAPVCVVYDGREALKKGVAPFRLEPREGLRTIDKWDKPRGPGAARHAGIVSSEAALIVICDGHMTFPEGWMDEIEGYHKHRQNRLTCCRMQSLGQDGEPLPDAPRSGAELIMTTKEAAGNFWALSAKWHSGMAG